MAFRICKLVLEGLMRSRWWVEARVELCDKAQMRQEPSGVGRGLYDRTYGNEMRVKVCERARE